MLISSRQIKISFWGSLVFVVFGVIYQVGIRQGKRVSDPVWISKHEAELVAKASKEPLLRYGGDKNKVIGRGVVVDGPIRFEVEIGKPEAHLAVVRVKIIGEPDRPDAIRVVGALATMESIRIQDNIRIGDIVTIYDNGYYWEQLGYYHNIRFAVKEK